MNKFSENLIASFGRKLAIIKTVKTISYGRQIAFILSLTVVPIVVQAAAYQTYVIHTYGGDALLPSVRQQLNASRDGGTVSIYQDKLVLRTTASSYQAIQKYGCLTDCNKIFTKLVNLAKKKYVCRMKFITI